MDERLLAPCTRALLEGWTGPAVLTADRMHAASGEHQPVIVSGRDDGIYLLDGDWLDYDPAYLPVVFNAHMAPVGTLALDLSLAECRDRVCREGAEMYGWDDLKVSALRNDPVALAAVWREVSRG